MQKFYQALADNKFRLHLTAFMMMLIPTIPLYLAAQNGATVLIWCLVAIVVLGNILVIIVP